MYDHNTLKPIAELEAYHQRNMNWYDSQPYVVRALIQERGLGAVKSARAALRVTQSHVPSTPDSDSVTYTGVDFGNDDRSEFVIVDEWGTIKRW